MKHSVLIDSLRYKVQSNRDYYEGCFDIIPNKGFHTLWLCGLAAIRFQEKKDIKLLSVADKYYDLLELSGGVTIIKKQDNWTTLLHTEEISHALLNNIDSVFKKCFIEGANDSFGCCSRYEECSDEKHCIHPDKEMARGCMYKINLDSGRIFYGVNRNID